MSIFKITWYVFLMFGLVLRSWADCPEVRMDQADGSMEHVPMRTQYLGTCYIYAASAAYDAHRFSRLGDDRLDLLTNPLHGALQYKQRAQVLKYDEKSSFVESGVTEEALRILLENGSCLMDRDSDFNYLTLFVNANRERHREFIDRLLLIFEEQQKRLDDFRGQKLRAHIADHMTSKPFAARDKTQVHIPGIKIIESTKDIRIEDEREYHINRVRNNFLSQLDSIRSAYFNNAIENYVDSVKAKKFSDNIYQQAASQAHSWRNQKEDSEIEYLSNIMFKGCEMSDPDKATIYSSRRDRTFENTDKWLQNKIDEMLTSKSNQENLPIIASICHNIMLTQNSIGLKRGINGNEYFKICGHHAVLVIGSRKNPKTNRCEYLIRNSWGKRIADKPWPTTTDGLSQWVPRDQFVKNTYSLLRIE